MSDPPLPNAGEETHPRAATFESLVPGLNPAFLRDRLAIPLRVDVGVMRWGLADPNDRETLAALRFASRMPIAPTFVPRDTILGLLAESLGAVGRRFDAEPGKPAVPHADAVLRLRAQLVRALDDAADAVEISAPEGMLAAFRAEVPLSRDPVGAIEAEALIAAARALSGEGVAAGRPAHFSLAYRGARVRVTVVSLPSGVALMLTPIDAT